LKPLILEQGCKQIKNIEVLVSSRNNMNRRNNCLRKSNLLMVRKDLNDTCKASLINEERIKMALFNVRSISGKTSLIYDILSGKMLNCMFLTET